MKEIVTAIMIWLGANTQFDTNHDIPTIIFLPQEKLNSMYFNDNDHDPESLHGMYNKKKNIIYLRDDWDRRDPWDLGVLTHEIVHYLQDMNEMRFACTREMERDAWPIQKDYLKKVHKFDWNYDQLWYIMISTCDQF
jgi:hypothetical protein